MMTFQPLVTIFLLVSIGIFCRKLNLFDAAEITGFERLLFRIVLPTNLFIVVYKNNLADLMNLRFVIAYLVAFGGIACLIIGISKTRAFSADSRQSVWIRVMAAGYVNTGLYTLPVITLLLQNPTAAILAVLTQVTILQPLFISGLTYYIDDGKPLLLKLCQGIFSPFIVIPFTGILLNYFQLELPVAVFNAVNQLGVGASGLALIIFGLTLGGTQFRQLIGKKQDQFPLVALVVTKTIIHPAIAFFVGIFFHLDPYWRHALMIAASAPTAFVVYMIAKEFSIDETLIQNSVAVSALVSALVLVGISVVVVFAH